jgi:hypothetical protein
MRRTSVLTFGCLLVLTIVAGLWFTRPTSGQGQPAAPPAAGRYQVSAFAGGVVVIDSTTGRCWVTSDAEKWQDMGSPVEPKK